MKQQAGGGSRRQDGSHRPLAGKAVFLDVPGFRGATAFEHDLKRLGGTIERCFSKEVGWLITNSKAYMRELEALKNAATSPSNLSPANPSPFNTAVAYGALDSLLADSPGGTGHSGGHKPMTRGMAIAQKAKNTKNYGSTNLVETAKQWKIKIVPLDQAQKYVTREIAKLPAPKKDGKSKDEVPQKKKKVRPLKGDFIKFESFTQQYKPLQYEYPALPTVNTDTLKGSCPFENRTKKAHKAGNKEPAEQEGAKGLQDVAKGKGKGRHVTQHRDKEREISTVYASNKLFTAAELRRIMIEKAKTEQKKGYCELCNVKYENIDAHLKLESHKKFVRNEKNFISLDLIIARGPNMEQFLDDVLKYHHEHVREGLQMSEMEDEVILMHQDASHTKTPSIPAVTREQESTKTVTRKVQFQDPSQRVNSALKAPSEAVESMDNVVAKGKDAQPRSAVVKKPDTASSLSTAKGQAAVKNIKLVAVQEKGAESTPPRSESTQGRRPRGKACQRKVGPTPTPDKITPKPASAKIVPLQSLLSTPKKPPPIVSTPKSIRNVSSVDSPIPKSRLDAAKRLLANALSTAEYQLPPRSSGEERKAPRSSSECSDIIPIIGKITPVNSSRAPPGHVSSSVCANAGTMPSTPRTPASPPSVTRIVIDGQIAGITKLPDAGAEKKEEEEACSDAVQELLKVTKIDLSVVSCSQTFPDQASRLDAKQEVTASHSPHDRPLFVDDDDDDDVDNDEKQQSQNSSKLNKTGSVENQSLPSKEEILEAAVNAGLFVVACPSVKSNTSYDLKSRPNPPLKTYSRKSPVKSESPATSKHESTSQALLNEKSQVTLEHNYSSPIKRDPTRKREMVEEKEEVECSPKTPQGRQRMKAKHQWSILSDRSMKRILQSDGDHVFEGFDERNQNLLPTDVSYVDVSGISISDHSDVELDPASSPVKKRPKLQQRRPSRPKPRSEIPTPLLETEPHVDIVDESNNPAPSWEGVKGAENILNSYFSPYLQGVQQEKLWMNSSPIKDPDTPVKRQEETESLTSIAEDKVLDLPPPIGTPVKSLEYAGPMHSTPVLIRPHKSVRRSPRKRLCSVTEEEEEEEEEEDEESSDVPVLNTSGVVPFKGSFVNNTSCASYKSPPPPMRTLTPQSTLRALTSQNKSVPKHKHIPAQMVLNRSDASETSSVVSSKKLLKLKSFVRKSYSFDYMASSSKKQCSQKDFDKLVQDYQSSKGAGADDTKTSLETTLPLAESGTKSQQQVKAPSSTSVKSDGSKTETTPGFEKNLRLSLTIMKSSKKGCLCHEHTLNSPCPLANTPKRRPRKSDSGDLKTSEPTSSVAANRKRRAQTVRKRLDSIVNGVTVDTKNSVKSKPKDITINSAKSLKSKPAAKLLRNSRPAQPPPKSPRKNLAKIMLETVGRNTRKSSKWKQSDSDASPAKIRAAGINQYDFSSGLDF